MQAKNWALILTEEHDAALLRLLLRVNGIMVPPAKNAHVLILGTSDYVMSLEKENEVVDAIKITNQMILK